MSFGGLVHPGEITPGQEAGTDYQSVDQGRI